MDFKILTNKLLVNYIKSVKESPLDKIKKIKKIEIPVDYFQFYKSISSVYSSKIEGENELRPLKNPRAKHITLAPPWIFEGGDDHSRRGGGMNKTAVAYIDSHMGNVIRGIVRFGEKDQITRLQCIAVQNNLAISGLVLRTMGQRDFMGCE